MVLSSSQHWKHTNLQICPQNKALQKPAVPIPSWWMWFDLSPPNDSHLDTRLSPDRNTAWADLNSRSGGDPQPVPLHSESISALLTFICPPFCAPQGYEEGLVPFFFFLFLHTPSLKLTILLHTWHGVTSSKDLRICLCFFFLSFFFKLVLVKAENDVDSMSSFSEDLF